MEYIPPFNGDLEDPARPWINANPGIGVEGSIPSAEVFDQPQREILNLIQKSGWTPSAGDLAQMTRSVRSQRLNFATATGSANALVISLDPAPVSMSELVGMPLRIVVGSANTSGTVTLSVNGLPATNIRRRNSSTLAPKDIQPGIIDVVYDGTVFRLMAAPWGASTVASSGYVDLPGGITLQWGAGSTTSGTATVSFPKAFSAAPYTVVATDNGAGSWSTTNASFCGTGGASASAVTIRSVTWNGIGTGMIETTTLFTYYAIGPT